MTTCGCEAASQRTFTSVRDGIPWGRTSVLRDPVEVARSEEKGMMVLRCRSCGTEWAEACWSSGHMEVYYVFPVPGGEDPVLWLTERAEPLEWDASGPNGSAPSRTEPG